MCERVLLEWMCHFNLCYCHSSHVSQSYCLNLHLRFHHLDKSKPSIVLDVLRHLITYKPKNLIRSIFLVPPTYGCIPRNVSKEDFWGVHFPRSWQQNWSKGLSAEEEAVMVAMSLGLHLEFCQRFWLFRWCISLSEQGMSSISHLCELGLSTDVTDKPFYSLQ